MLIPNVCEIDQLPFLKLHRYNWLADEEEGQKNKIRLLQNLRSMTYQSFHLMSKIFVFQKQVKKDNSHTKQSQEGQPKFYQQLIATTEKEIMPLQNYYYLLNQSLAQQEFSQKVHEIKKFVAQCKQYFRDLALSKFQIDFGKKQFLTFGIYLEKLSPDSLNFKKQNLKHMNDCFQKFVKNNNFSIKCALTNFDFKSFKEITVPKVQKPYPFKIQNKLVTQKLFKIYLDLSNTVLPVNYKDVKKYISLFDEIFYQIDEEYLKLQVFKNYPLLRSKFYLPIRFNDYLTNDKLDGPIFSNSDPDCMFSHFIGYNADTVRVLQGNNCQQCRSYFEGVQQNPILTSLRDNLFNPCKQDVFFCPEFNRFKLIAKIQPKSKQNAEDQQSQDQSNHFKTQIKYLNYLHLRLNLRKTYSKKRNKFNDMLREQKFKLSFQFWGKKLLIMDPVRGRNCSHYEFTDLRLFYLNKVTLNTFKCPICNDVVSDNDILYLKQVQILVKYLKFKTAKLKQLTVSGQCFINHAGRKIFLQFKKRSKQQSAIIERQILQIKGFYQTFIDPYVSFNQYSLGIPDKYQRKLRQKYLFGFDKQNQENSSEEDDQFYGRDYDDFKEQQGLQKQQQIQQRQMAFKQQPPKSNSNDTD